MTEQGSESTEETAEERNKRLKEASKKAQKKEKAAAREEQRKDAARQQKSYNKALALKIKVYERIKAGEPSVATMLWLQQKGLSAEKSIALYDSANNFYLEEKRSREKGYAYIITGVIFCAVGAFYPVAFAPGGLAIVAGIVKVVMATEKMK